MNDIISEERRRQHQAAHWHMRMTGDDVSAEERRQFHDWLLADPRNGEEYIEAVLIWEQLGEVLKDRKPPMLIIPAQPVELEPPAAFKRPERFTPGSSKSRLLPIAATVLLLAGTVGAWMLWRQHWLPESFSSNVGEMHTVTFEDGSVVRLNTRTSLRWLGDRSVALDEGEALFDVAQNINQPFRVILERSEIRVLGTRFNVYRRPDGEVTVTVVEGAVQVTQQNPAWNRKVVANESFDYTLNGDARPVRQTDAMEEILWPEGKVRVENATLPQLLNEFSRYTNDKFVIADPRVNAVTVGGTFSTRNIPSVLTGIEERTGVHVTRRNNEFILSFRADDLQ